MHIASNFFREFAMVVASLMKPIFDEGERLGGVLSGLSIFQTTILRPMAG